MSLDAARQALETGDPREALQLCREVLAVDPRDPGVHYLGAEALRDLGAFNRAEQWYLRAVEIDGGFSSAWSGMAAVRFDQIDLRGASESVNRAIRSDDGNPEAYYIRALLRERRLDHAGAWRDYHRACQLDQRQFPLPVALDDDAVGQAVDEVLAMLPTAIRESMHRVVFALEDVPSEEICLDFDPPTPPADLLGLFQGPSVADPIGYDSASVLPPTILLFRCNLQRIAWDREHLLQELRVTLFHEIGHYLGLDEDDLHARGLG